MRPIMSYVTRSAMLAVLALSVVACTPGGGQPPTPVAPTSSGAQSPTTEATRPPPTSTTEPSPAPTLTGGSGQNIAGSPMVDSVEVHILESQPLQVTFTVKGNLPDPCTKLDEVSTTREGNTIKVRITTSRPADAMCAQVLTPFEETYPIDAHGLKKGTYTLDVEGVTTTFEMLQDNP